MELLSVTMNDGVMPRSEIEGKDNSSEDKSNYKVVLTGDMVYNSMRMWQGANGIAPCDGIVSPAYTVLMPKIPISNGYFAALFKSTNLINEFRKNSQGMTSDTWNLKYPQIETIKVCIPTLSEQERIADMLGTLEQRIAKQAQLVDSLKKYKRGAFDAVFTQKIRLIPEHEQREWTVFNLSDFATRITRKNGNKTDIPLTISAQYGLIDQRKYFSKTVASSDMSGYFLLHQGEFAYNRSTSNDYPLGSIKRLEQHECGAVSTLYLCFAIKESVVLPELAKWYFETSLWHKGVREICAEGARSHGLLNVPTEGFFTTTHKLPFDLEEQRKIANYLGLIHRKCEEAEDVLMSLIRLRNGLVQRLFI